MRDHIDFKGSVLSSLSMPLKLRKFPKSEIGNYLIVGLLNLDLLLVGAIILIWGLETGNGILFLAGFVFVLMGYMIEIDYVPPASRVAPPPSAPTAPAPQSPSSTPSSSEDSPMRKMIREELHKLLNEGK